MGRDFDAERCTFRGGPWRKACYDDRLERLVGVTARMEPLGYQLT